MGTSALDRIFGEEPKKPGALDRLFATPDPAKDLGSSIRSVTILKPSDAQDAYRLSGSTGVPVDVAIRNLDRLRAESAAPDFDAEDFARRFPVTTRAVSRDQSVAQLAKDEYEQLGFLERTLGSWRMPTLADVDRAMVAPGTVEPMQTRRGILQEEWRRALDMDAARVGILAPSQREPYRNLLADIERERETPLPESASGIESFLRASARIAPSIAETVEAGGVGAAVGAVVGGAAGLVGGPVGVAAGATAGSKAGALLNATSTAFLMEAGTQALAFEKLTDPNGTPIDPNLAYQYGLMYGAGSAALEMVGLRSVGKPLVATGRNLLNPVLGEATAAALRTPTTRGAILNGAKAWATAVGGETATEVGQQSLSLIVESDLTRLSNVARGTQFGPITGERVYEELMATATETAMGMALLGVPGGAGVTMVDAARVKQAENRRAWMESVATALDQAPMTAGVPEVMQGIIADNLEASGGPQTMFVAADRLAVLLQENEVPLPQFAQAIGTPVADIEAAMAGGADVAIPTADFLAKMVRTDLGAAMLDDIRYAPGEMTAREAKAQTAAIEKDYGPVREAMQVTLDSSSLTGSEQRVYDWFRQSLEATGAVPGNRLDIDAELASRMFIVTARKWAESNPEHPFADPWTLLQSRNLRIIAPERAEPLYQMVQDVHAAEKAKDFEKASQLRGQMKRLLDDGATIRSALEMADQTLEVRDAEGRLRKSLRFVSDESLVLEYIRLRGAQQSAAMEAEQLDMAMAQAEADNGVASSAEEVAGRVLEAGFADKIPGFADAESWEGQQNAYSLYRRRQLNDAMKAGRSLPRLERELASRGITNPDQYADERGYGLDASFDPSTFGAVEQAVSDSTMAGVAMGVPVRFGAWDQPREGDAQAPRGYRIRESTTATERRLVQEIQKKRGWQVTPDDGGLWPLFGFWDMREAWFELREQGTTLPLEQGGSGKKRPNAYLLPFNRERVIGLTSTANASSFLHEVAHEYLYILAETATAPDAPASITEDLAQTLNWLGVATAADIKTEQQEKFARTFESYLQSGQAPSAGLARAFHRLRVWLTALYQSFLQAEYPVTDDIRRVFDRMLATDAELMALRNQPESRPLFEDAATMGMTEAQWDAYVATFDLRDAEVSGRVVKDVLVEDNHARQQAWAAQEATVTARVEAEVYARPEVQAVRYFRTGRLPDGSKVEKPVRLSKEALVAMFDETILVNLPKGVYQAVGGLDPDAAAAMFNAPDGMALISALQEWENPEETVARQVAEIRQREFPEMLDDSPALAEAVKRAAERGQADAPVLAELRVLGQRLGIEPPNVPAVKLAAAGLISGMRVRDIRPAVYRQAERSVAIKAERAYRAGDMVQAEFHKRQQLLNRILARTAQEAVDLSEKALAFGKKMDARSAQETLGFAGTAHVDAMDALLDAYEFRRVPLRELDYRAAITAFVEEQAKDGGDVLIAPEVVSGAAQVNYRSLPFSVLSDVYDAMRQVYATALARSKMLAGEERQSVQDAIGQLVGEAEAHRALIAREYVSRTDQTLIDRVGEAAEYVNAAHIKPEMLLRIMDGDQSSGPWQTQFMRRAANAQATESEMLGNARVALVDVWSDIPLAERKKWKDRTITIPERKRKISKATAIAVVLNMGNVGNIERLLDAQIDAEGVFTAAELQAIASSLSAAELRSVQKVWNYIESYWPQIAELERTMTGVTPEKVEPNPLTVTTVDGQVVQLKGGYYPIKYDGRYDARTAGMEQAQLRAAEEGNPITRGSRAHTKHGHTEARTGAFGRPLDLSLDVIARHVGEVIHDLSHREAIYDMQRLLLDSKVERAVTLTAGRTAYRSLNVWVKRMAQGDEVAKNLGERIILRARAGVTVANMGLKVTTSVMQLSGILPAIDFVGVTHMRRAAMEFLTPGGSGAEAMIPGVRLVRVVQGLSSEMRDRVNTLDRDIRAVSKGGTMSEREAQWFILTQMSDQVVATITWWAQYQKSLGQGVKQDEAVQQADSAVRLSQGAGAPKDLAMAQGGPAAMRMFTLFSSYAFTLYGMFYRANKNVKEARWGKGRWAASMLFIWLLPAVLEPLMVDRGPDEEDSPEEKALWWAWQVGTYPAQTVMGLRDLVRGMGPENYDANLTPLSDVVVQTARAGMALPELLGLGDGLSESEVRALVNTAGYWGQLPSKQLWISGSYLYDWMMGYTEPETLLDAVRGLSYTQPR